MNERKTEEKQRYRRFNKEIMIEKEIFVSCRVSYKYVKC